VNIRDCRQFVDKSLRNREYSAELIKKFYEIKSTNSLDIKEGSEDLVSVAMIIKYIEETQLMDPST
jgi:hypothetical protein